MHIFRKAPEPGDEAPQRLPELPWPGIPMSLRVSDGFKFGCGFMLALATTVAILVLFVAVAVLVAKLSGADITVPSPGTSAPTPVLAPPILAP